MKTIAKFMVLSVLLFGSEANASESTLQNAAVGETILIKAKGLVCDFCVRALEKTSKKRPEIAGFSVDLTTKLIEIKLKKGSSMDDEAIQKFVTDAGYNIESIERK